MQTPEDYMSNLKKNVITRQMVCDAIVSLNARARNWREREAIFRGRKDFGNAAHAAAQQKALYAKKEVLLSLLTPDRIHQEVVYPSKRICSDDTDFYDCLLEGYVTGRLHYFGGYYNRRRKDAIDTGEAPKYWFAEIYEEKPLYRYFLFYPYGRHGFHSPLHEALVHGSGFPVYKIDKMSLTGMGINDLLSLNVVNKMVHMISSGKYIAIGCELYAQDKARYPEKGASRNYPPLSPLEQIRCVHAQDMLEKKIQSVITEKLQQHATDMDFELTETEKKRVTTMGKKLIVKNGPDAVMTPNKVPVPKFSFQNMMYKLLKEKIFRIEDVADVWIRDNQDVCDKYCKQFRYQIEKCKYFVFVKSL